MRELDAVCRECRQQRARIVFVTHDLEDEFSAPSDVARMYALRSAPRFLFFVDVRRPGSAWERSGLCMCMRMRGGAGGRLRRLPVDQPPCPPPPPPPSLPQGALMRTASMADSRVMASSRSQVERALHAEHRRLRDTLFELLVKNAPSARK